MNEAIGKWYEQYADQTIALAKALWEDPELAMEEFHACALTADFLRKQGFSVETFHCRDEGVPPNTVVATWGSGKPVIGIMGEYDALPGLGQDAVPYPSRREGSGHGCGHCLMTPACSSAAAALKAALEAEHLPGTIRFIAAPAEEGGMGKVHLMKRGVFEGLDCCMAWHPMDYDITPYEGVLQAMAQLKFEFFGKAAHAAVCPEQGRSALDAAELMNVGVQYLREHVPDDVRIHYSYLAAGERPNIVPDYAALSYYVRGKNIAVVDQIVERVKKVAQGAAIMTETRTECTHLGSMTETCIINGFNQFLYQSASKIPRVEYTAQEHAFADTLYENIIGKKPTCEVLPAALAAPTGVERHVPGSTDAGCVTKSVPTGRLFGLGIVRGIPAHHWGVTASVGMSIGHKAALFAGKALAQCGYDIVKNPAVLDTWWEELRTKTKQ